MSWRADLRSMKSTLAGCAIAVGASSTLAGGAWIARQGTERAARDAHSQLKRQAAALADARRDRAGVGLYLERYRALERDGFVGEARPAQWIEALGAARAARRIASIRYSASDAARHPAPPVDAGEGVDLMVSRIQMEAPLEDESQLFALLADMRARAGGVFLVRNCTLKRSAGADESARSVVSARCALDFMTVTDSTVAKASDAVMPAPGR